MASKDEGDRGRTESSEEDNGEQQNRPPDKPAEGKENKEKITGDKEDVEMDDSMQYSVDPPLDASMMDVLQPYHVPGKENKEKITGDKEDVEMDDSMQYSVDPPLDASMMDVLKPYHVPDNLQKTHKIQEKTGHDKVSTDKCLRIEDAENSSSSSIEAASDDEGSGALERSAARASMEPPIKQMLQDSPQLNVNSEEKYKVQNVFGDYLLKDIGTGFTVAFPEGFKSGPNIEVQRDYLKDDDGTIFQIKKDVTGDIIIAYVTKALGETSKKSVDERNKSKNQRVQNKATNLDSEQEGPQNGTYFNNNLDSEDENDIPVTPNNKVDLPSETMETELSKNSGEFEDYDMLPELRDEKNDQKKEKDAEKVSNQALKKSEEKKNMSVSVTDRKTKTKDHRDVQSGDRESCASPVEDPPSAGNADLEDKPDIPPRKTKQLGDSMKGGHNKFEVKLKVSDASGRTNVQMMPCELDIYLKIQYMIKNPEKVAADVNRYLQQEEDLCVKFENEAVCLVKKIGEMDDYAMRSSFEKMTKSSDFLFTNSLPTEGIDTEALLTEINQSSIVLEHGMYFFLDKDRLHCAYPTNCIKEAELCMNSSFAKIRCCEEKITVKPVFSEVLEDTNFSGKLKRTFPVVEADMKEIGNDFVIILKGPTSQLVAAKKMLYEHLESFSLNEVSFKDVKMGHHFQNLSDIVEKELVIEKIQLAEKEEKLYFHINEEIKKITICSDRQEKLDRLSNMIKKGLIVSKEEDVPEDIEMEAFRKKFEELLKKCGDEGIFKKECTDRKVIIAGCRQKVQYIKQEMHTIWKEERTIQRAREQHIDVKDPLKKDWNLPNGHWITVTNRPVEHVEKDLLVNVAPADHNEGPDIPKADSVSSLKVANLPIPLWKGGGHKEKKNVTEAVDALMESATIEDRFNIVLKMSDKEVNGWPWKKLTKSILGQIKEYFEQSQSHPMVVTFSCSTDVVFSDCCRICKNAIAEQSDIGDEQLSETEMSMETLVEVKIGSLHEFKTDVIVNSVDQSLNLNNGYVSKTILKYAGPQIQDEVKKKKKTKNDAWEIIETQAYNLEDCTMVLHGTIARYESASSLQELQNFVYRCLCTTAERGLQSIAFPALGTGNLKYPKEGVARTMFAAVRHYMSETRDKPSVQRIVFVLYDKDEENKKAFNDQFTKFKRGEFDSGSKKLAVGDMSLQAVHGQLPHNYSGVLIYLWERNHMNHVMVKENPLLKNLPSKVQADWASARDKQKKQKEDQPFVTQGDPIATAIVHSPCADNKRISVIQSLYNALNEAEQCGKEHVTVYFNNTHPLSTANFTVLPEQIIEALKRYDRTSNPIKDVKLLIERVELFQYFCRKIPEIETSFERMEPDTEPPPQAITDRGADLPELPASTIKWDRSRLQQYGMEKYVLLKNIPKDYTEDKLKATLYSKRFPVRPPHVAYSSSLHQAVLICHEENEAKQLVSWTFSEGISASRPTQSLLKYRHVLQDELSLRLMQTRSVFDWQNFDVALKPENNKIVIHAPTLCQMTFALEKISAIDKGVPAEMSTQQIIDGDTEVVSDEIAIPEINFRFLLQAKGKEIDEFERSGGTINFTDGILFFTTPTEMSVPPDIMAFAKTVCTQQVDEVKIDTEWTEKAVQWCAELSEPEKGIQCRYETSKQMVFVCSERYDDLKRIKHRLNVLQEKVKITRRARQHGASSEPYQSLTARSNDAEAKSATNIDFLWQRDASHRQFYKTDEGIQIYVYKASILKLPVDCIVNAANEMLQHGGGVAQKIEQAAGYALTQESDDIIKKKGKIPVGMCCSTTAGKLHYKSVIHTVGPRWGDYWPHTLEKVEECQTKLYLAIMSSLLKAEAEHMTSIALPAISSAIFGVPEEICTYQYAKATVDYSKKSVQAKNRLKEIHFVDINAQIIQQIQQKFDGFINQGQPPDYDSQMFVKTPSQPPEKRYSSSRGSESWQPTVVKIKEGNKTIFHVGQSNRLHIYTTDIFSVSCDALVCVTDCLGNANSRIAFEVNDKVQPRQDYEKEKSINRKSTHEGSVFVTKGHKSGFRNIVHVALPQNFEKLPGGKKKSILKHGYSNILQCCQEKKGVHSVAISHLGTNTELSAEVFFDSYLEFSQIGESKMLELHFVCFEKKKSDIVYKMFNQYAMKTAKVSVSNVFEKTAISDDTLLTSVRTFDTIKTMDESKKKSADVESSAAASDTGDESCVICMDKITAPRTLDCGHSFCTDCIEQSLSYKKTCPTCGAVCGVVTGDQPQGTMHVYSDRTRYCSGHDNYGQIKITYSFPNGIQEKCHPNPGAYYQGISRSAFLPDNRQGNIILQMLRVAFNRKLVFTIGSSRTTGEEGVITWNDIHHKTNPNPHGKFGYPDPTYLQRVTEELQVKGVTEKDIPAKELEAINAYFKGAGELRWKTSQRKYPRH